MAGVFGSVCCRLFAPVIHPFCGIRTSVCVRLGVCVCVCVCVSVCVCARAPRYQFHSCSNCEVQHLYILLQLQTMCSEFLALKVGCPKGPQGAISLSYVHHAANTPRLVPCVCVCVRVCKPRQKTFSNKVWFQYYKKIVLKKFTGKILIGNLLLDNFLLERESVGVVHS